MKNLLVHVCFLQMHLNYMKEGIVSSEPNRPEPVTTAHTAPPPSQAARQTSSGKDRGKMSQSNKYIAEIKDQFSKPTFSTFNTWLELFCSKVQPKVLESTD